MQLLRRLTGEHQKIELKTKLNLNFLDFKCLNRLDQKHKREFLQGQISYQHEKERDEQNRDFTDKATKDAQNVNLNGAHKLQTQEEKQQNANQVSGNCVNQIFSWMTSLCIWKC